MYAYAGSQLLLLLCNHDLTGKIILVSIIYRVALKSIPNESFHHACPVSFNAATASLASTEVGFATVAGIVHLVTMKWHHNART